MFDDIVELMRTQLRSNLAGLQNAAEQNRVKAERTERFAKRFKIKKSKRAAPPNVLREILEAKAGEMRIIISNGERLIQTMNLALKILDDFQFEPEARANVFVDCFSSSTTAGWT